MLMLWGFKLLL